MPETNDKNVRDWDAAMADPALAQGWAEATERDRAESPDGKTGFDRLLDRQARVKVTVQHNGIVKISTCDHCTGTTAELLAVLEKVAGLVASGRVVIDPEG